MGVLIKEVVKDGISFTTPLNCPNCKTNDKWIRAQATRGFTVQCIGCGCRATFNDDILPIKFDNQEIRSAT